MDTLTVNISSPNRSPHNFAVLVSRQCSILELKEIIVTRLDTQPSTADQRLIFGGRILEDKDTLDHVFEKVDCTESSPTIHLVVSQRQYPTVPALSASLRIRDATQSTAPITTSTSNTAATSATNLNTHNTFTPFAATTTTTQQGRAESSTSNNFPATAVPSSTSVPTANLAYAQFTSAQLSLQPMQYVFVNGMPYLVPAVYLPMLHQQQCMQQTHFFAPYPYYGTFMMNADGTPYFQPISMGDHARAATGPGEGAAAGADGNVQDNAARDQRRAASLWLLMKLAFGVYLFSQNGSIERIVLLHITALIIFL
ncbi:hypothetical protein BGZ65_006803 [Modicella reniformis]|uniref:Ubiquitin-like domain-containing protein n=1 Tax=Modicella reniformis TaxID=1440133 RepID=A0A9P6MBX5_9FUNG|nr:hypothetical protein BGZ65_006803 [Modicella reniformis]